MNFSKLIKPYYRRIMMMVGRAVISRVNDMSKMQIIQATLQASETRADLERLQEYGFTSVPKEGAEAAILFVGGVRDHGLVIAVDDRRYRLTGLADGEVAIYTDEGDNIHFKRGNKIEVNTQTFEINTDTYVVNAATQASFNTPNLGASGNFAAVGEVSDHSGSMQEMRNIYNSHDHNESIGSVTTDPNQEMN